MVNLGAVCERVSDSINPSDFTGKVNYVGLENIESNNGVLTGDIEANYEDIKSAKTRFIAGQILYGKLRPNLNKVYLAKQSGICSTDIFVLRSKQGTDADFIAHMMRSSNFNEEVLKGLGGAQLPRVSFDYLSCLEIPLPPLAVQQEIVAEIESYQKIINGARQVMENYKPRIDIRPDWPTQTVEELCLLGRGRVISKQDIEAAPGPYPVYSSQTQNDGIFGYLSTYDFQGEYVTWTTDGANAGTVFYRNGKFNCTNVCGTLKKKPAVEQQLNMRFLAKTLNALTSKHVVQVGNPKLMNMVVAKISVPVPGIETQNAIVAQIEQEQRLVDANKELIGLFEAKIKATIGRVWGEEPSLAEEPIPAR